MAYFIIRDIIIIIYLFYYLYKIFECYVNKSKVKKRYRKSNFFWPLSADWLLSATTLWVLSHALLLYAPTTSLRHRWPLPFISVI